MTRPVSRRAFLKAGLGAACAAAAAPAVCAAGPAPRDGHLATLIDVSRCIGCGACVEACRESNAEKFPDPRKPFPRMYPSRVKVSDWSDRQEVDDRLTPYNWLYIQHAEVTVEGETREITLPRRCMHCVNPPCVKLCPWGAARQYANGISRIDMDMCLGGSKCQAVCPWDIPQRQTGDGLYLDLLPGFAGNGIMNKCDRCYDRVARGKTPACIEACPEDVQTIGPRKEILEKARILAGEMNGYLYGEKENGGTNTIYVSPVPFEQLGRAVDTGPGRPHFDPVEDTMADANRLGTAMLIAPLAGVAAAAGKAFLAVRRRSSDPRRETRSDKE
ncbi:MAG: 4Fe-4S dicluster domain-containing protein [Desulfobacterales bacterium]